MQAVFLVLGFSDRVLPVLWAGLELPISAYEVLGLEEYPTWFRYLFVVELFCSL